jgi:hypothetical protein
MRACVCAYICQENGVDTVDKLVALFFSNDRDEGRFIEALEEMGIQNQFARECAANMVKKLGAL